MEYDDDAPMFDEDSMTFNRATLEDYQNFNRPPLDISTNQDLFLMNIDIAPSVKYRTINNVRRPDPEIKIYAVNEVGNSVEVNVRGFVPYFYSELPDIEPTEDKEILAEIARKINEHFAQI
jgi:hypothetical protein